ncbi:MAG: PBP1A family penicillin-binding protein [Clostridia bacterium]|nr:PBP1A family penicillin-binding protein [Clostridia bacterium]
MRNRNSGERAKTPGVKKYIAPLIIFFLIAAVALMGFAANILKDLPEISEDSLKPEILTTFIYDKDGNRVTDLHGIHKCVPVKLKDVPEELINAVIAVEDRDFFKHRENTWTLIKAFLSPLKGEKSLQDKNGITMQLVENIFHPGENSKDYREKIKKTYLALKMEQKFSKEEILEAYLNQIYFGHGAYGVQAAAQTYFGKGVGDLTLGECALIAGIADNPEAYSPFNNPEAAKKRRDTVLNSMAEEGYIGREEAEKTASEPLNLIHPEENESHKYPYFIDAVVQETQELLKQAGLDHTEIYRKGYRIYTTLDPSVQEKMQDIYSNRRKFPPGSGGGTVESTMVVLDHRTGEIRGLVGGRSYSSGSSFNRSLEAKRQPGTILTPFIVYAPALEMGYSPAYVVDDAPVVYKAPDGSVYRPQNKDGKFRGLITMREAMSLSLNVPAVKLLNEVGVEKGTDFAKKMGFSIATENEDLKAALGETGGKTTLMNLAVAYGASANGGVIVEPHTITKITDYQGKVIVKVTPKKKRVMSPQTAYLLTHMLKTSLGAQEGRAQTIKGNAAAGYSGQAPLPDLKEFKGLRGYQDQWFVGFTPKLLGAVWLGYDQTSPKQYLKDDYSRLCFSLWEEVMEEAHREMGPGDFIPPDGITEVLVDKKSGKLPSRITPKNYIIKELFREDKVPGEVSDVWIEKEICTETGLLASQFCPETTKEVFLKRPEVSGNVKPLDAALEAPKEVCFLHTTTGSYITVNVCTDPAHKGKYYLANIPVEGYLGGCPSKYIKKMNFPAGKEPREYCPIPAHQLKLDTGNNSGTVPPTPILKGSVSRGEGGKPLVRLQWKVPDNSGTILYSIERWTPLYPIRFEIAITSKNIWTDVYVKPGNTYYYRVVAVDVYSNLKSPSNRIEVSVPAN